MQMINQNKQHHKKESKVKKTGLKADATKTQAAFWAVYTLFYFLFRGFFMTHKPLILF